MFVPIIRSLIDTDLYKFTMWQAFLHHYPGNQAEYRFVCRNQTQYGLGELKDEIEAQLDHLCTLSFTAQELDYLSTMSFFKNDFIDFQRIFRFQRRYIEVTRNGEKLEIVARGPQIHVMGFEIFVLSIVNELYFRRFATERTLAEGRRRLAQKVGIVKAFASGQWPGVSEGEHPFEFFDFGTRRRFSREWHEEVVTTLARELPDYFKGTSNVYLAMKLGIVAMGTMAHEYLQTFQGVDVQLRSFQKEALETWAQEYRGELGIALTDVIGMDAFLRDCDRYFTLLFDGLRHDSGNPFVWGEKALAHYKRMRVNAHGKRLVWSNRLDLPEALKLYGHFSNLVQCGFGIGTNLSNDMGIEALNIVMKLMEINGQPTAKLSDTPGKTLCTDKTFLAYLRQQFNVAA